MSAGNAAGDYIGAYLLEERVGGGGFALKRFSADDAAAIFERNGGTAYRLNDYPSLFAQPQVQHVEILKQLETAAGPISVVRAPWQFNGVNAAVRLSPPGLGQQTTEILREAGFDDASIRELREAGVVG